MQHSGQDGGSDRRPALARLARHDTARGFDRAGRVGQLRARVPVAIPERRLLAASPSKCPADSADPPARPAKAFWVTFLNI
jgi:hypothetical protein